MPPKSKANNKKSTGSAKEEKGTGKKSKPRTAGSGSAPNTAKKQFDFKNIEEAAQVLLENLPKNRAGGSANQTGGINRSDVMSLSHEIVKNSFKDAEMDRAQRSSLVMRLAQAAYRAAGGQTNKPAKSSDASSSTNEHSRSASIKPSETAKWSERFAGAGKEDDDNSFSGTMNASASQNRQGGDGRSKSASKSASKSYKTKRRDANGKLVPITQYTKEEFLLRLQSLTSNEGKFNYTLDKYKKRFGEPTAAEKARIPLLKKRAPSRSKSASKKKKAPAKSAKGKLRARSAERSKSASKQAKYMKNVKKVASKKPKKVRKGGDYCSDDDEESNDTSDDDIEESGDCSDDDEDQ